MAQNGGARPGAGRKPKAHKFAGPIAAVEEMIADRLPFLVDKAFELAEGVEVQRSDANGVRVYTTPPDIKAITYLVDRILGKPKQSVELGGMGGGPVEVSVAYVNDWRHPDAAIDDVEANPEDEEGID